MTSTENTNEKKLLKHRRHRKRWLIAAGVFLLIPLIAYLLLRTPAVQSYLTEKIIHYVARTYNIEMSLEGVDVALFDKVILEGLYIEDQQGDTLLYANSLKAYIDNFSYFDKEIALQKIELNQLNINILTKYDGTTNLDDLLEAFSSEDADTTESDAKPFNISCQNFSLTDSRFVYRIHQPEALAFGMNFDDLALSHLNIDIENFVLADTISVRIKHLSADERSGFRLTNLSTSALRYADHFIEIDDLRLQTPQTDLKTAYLNLRYKEVSDFSDFLNKITLETQFIDSATLCLSDLAYFSPELKGLDLTAVLDGKLEGTISNMEAKDLSIKLADTTHLSGDFTIKGLPYPDSLDLFLDLRTLTTSAKDIELITCSEMFAEDSIPLPDELHRLGVMTLNGHFEGTMTDFTTKSLLLTEVGDLKLDMHYLPDTTKGSHEFDGIISTTGLNLGQIMADAETFGQVILADTLTMVVYPDGRLLGEMRGSIKRLDILGYNYQNIKINGTFTEASYKGKLAIKDPNIDFKMDGLLDFTHEPVFDLKLFLNYARLNALNIDDRPGASLKFDLVADFTGLSPDKLIGKLDIVRFNYTNDNDQLRSKRIRIQAEENDTDGKLITLNSDFMTATIKGHYKFDRLTESFNQVLSHYLPSFTSTITGQPTKQKKENDQKHKIKFELALNNVDKITKIFYPALSISDSTSISGSYGTEDEDIYLNVSSPRIAYENYVAKRLQINTTSENKCLDIYFGTEQMQLGEGTSLDYLFLNTKILNDSIDIKLTWDNRENGDHSGKINLRTILDRPEGVSFPVAYINLFPSKFQVANSIWVTNESTIVVDTTSINIFGLRVTGQLNNDTDKQHLNISGTVSEDPFDELDIEFNNIDVSLINSFVDTSSIKLAGNLSGQSHLSNVYNQMLFTSDNKISDLIVNDYGLGDLYAESFYDQDLKNIDVNVYTLHRNDTSLHINGYYYPETEKLDFDISFHDFFIDFLGYYLDGVVSNLHGMLQTPAEKLYLTGTLSNPSLDGIVTLQKTNFKVDYINTHYWMGTTDVVVSNRQISFRSDLMDQKMRSAQLIGEIKHKRFSDFDLNVVIDANEKFLFLNTPEGYDDYYYGTAYATGLISITGSPEDIVINVSARTEKAIEHGRVVDYTRFYIPLTESGYVSEENNFLRFVSHDTTNMNSMSDEYSVEPSNMSLHFDLEVTPDAEVQLIFDEKVGDIIKARGQADLKVDISMAGDFYMYGTYEIVEGDYLFTLENIINKHLEVEKGGTITWSGDPYDADVNLKAIYKIKRTNLYDLIPEEEYKEVRVPVNCYLNMTGQLMKPVITFDIEIPSTQVSDHVKSQLKNLEEGDMNKQIISLIILNRFQTLPGYENTDPDYVPGGGVSTGELISNQLSHWLSQISKDVDIGVNYQPGDELTHDEVEVALSTQLLNDRVLVNTNVGVGGGNVETPNATTGDGTSSNLVGDFEVSVKLDQKGKVRMKAYTRANDQNSLEYDNAPTTQGLGIVYREEFDTFSELWTHYVGLLRALFKSQPKENKPDQQNDDPARVYPQDNPPLKKKD